MFACCLVVAVTAHLCQELQDACMYLRVTEMQLQGSLCKAGMLCHLLGSTWASSLCRWNSDFLPSSNQNALMLLLKPFTSCGLRCDVKTSSLTYPAFCPFAQLWLHHPQIVCAEGQADRVLLGLEHLYNYGWGLLLHRHPTQT